MGIGQVMRTPAPPKPKPKRRPLDSAGNLPIIRACPKTCHSSRRDLPGVEGRVLVLNGARAVTTARGSHFVNTKGKNHSPRPGTWRDWRVPAKLGLIFANASIPLVTDVMARQGERTSNPNPQHTNTKLMVSQETTATESGAEEANACMELVRLDRMAPFLHCRGMCLPLCPF